jgi:hypothetical protein
MQTKWTLGSASLPGVGEPVDFLLWDRKIPIHGAFADGVFHARWADYGIDRVELWCASENDNAVESSKISGFSLKAMFNRTLERWVHASSSGESVHPG